MDQFRRKKLSRGLSNITLATILFCTGYCMGNKPYVNFRKNIAKNMETVDTYVSEKQKVQYVNNYLNGLQPYEKVKFISGYVKGMGSNEQKAVVAKMYTSLPKARNALRQIVESHTPKDSYDKAADLVRNFVNEF